jgi:transposase
MADKDAFYPVAVLIEPVIKKKRTTARDAEYILNAAFYQRLNGCISNGLHHVFPPEKTAIINQ